MIPFSSWIEINLDKIKNNIKILKQLVSPSKLLVVVKADAYGHGILDIAKVAEESNVNWLGVFGYEEAVELRKNGIKTPILNFLYPFDWELGKIIDLDISQALYDLESARKISSIAQKKRKICKVQIKVDTGLRRIGIHYTKAVDFIIEVNKFKNIEIEGIYSTLGERSKKENEIQCKRLCNITSELEKRGIKIPLRHIASSVALYDKKLRLDMVRLGAVVYGFLPQDITKRGDLKIKPAITLKARIVDIKEVEKDEKIAYGNLFTTKRKMKIGIISAGWYNGLWRAMSNRGRAILHNKVVPIIGRVSMNNCIVDISGLSKVRIGDIATLFGQGKISIDAFAETCGTTNYEILGKLSPYIPRVYISNKKVSSIRLAEYRYIKPVDTQP